MVWEDGGRKAPSYPIARALELPLVITSHRSPPEERSVASKRALVNA